MEREHLIKEIQDISERIRNNASDADSLLTDVAHLYEMVILLKHLPEEVKTNGTIKTERVEVKVEIEKKTTEPLDLFSVAETSEPVVETANEKPEKKIVAKKSEESVTEKISHKKISDLKSVIGINEKFQFINELFDGNMKEYTVALDQINNFSTLGDAVNYLANLKEMYKWNSENPIASNFEELVQRRFF
ncbi:MAG: hypothetical protein HY063_03695 [Bacteroidetes bacterium]|nr:hypothetical protein [Bacteroidota bacterium]